MNFAASAGNTILVEESGAGRNVSQDWPTFYKKIQGGTYNPPVNVCEDEEEVLVVCAAVEVEVLVV